MATLFRYFKDLWKLAVVALVLAAINQIFSLLDPLIFRHIIDSYATRYREYSSPQFIRGVGLLLAAAVGVALVSRIAKNFQDYFVNVITQKVGARIYTDGVRHSLDLPYTLFEDQRSGETLGKMQRVRSDVEKFIALLVNMVFTTLIGLAFVTIYAARVHWSIAPAYLLTVPLLGSLSSLLSRRVKTVQKRIVTETTALAGSTTESLRNIELVKSLGLAQQEIDRLNSTTDKILKLELEKVRYLRSLSFVQGSFVNLLRTSILLLMLYLIYTHRITVGQFFSLFIYSFFIFGPLQELGNVVNAYRETEASLDNFEEILKMPTEQKPEHPVALPSLKTLEFDRVSFQHQSASSPALSEISFRVARGETIAFVGPSGAGKTSLVKLLVGLYRPKSGHIFYNGTPEDQVAIEDLRERIGFVTQDTQLFSGSIRENLQFVRPDATDEECLEVLRKRDQRKLQLGNEANLGAPPNEQTRPGREDAEENREPGGQIHHHKIFVHVVTWQHRFILQSGHEHRRPDRQNNPRDCGQPWRQRQPERSRLRLESRPLRHDDPPAQADQRSHDYEQ